MIIYQEICNSCPVVYYADENYPTVNSSSSLSYLTPLPSKTTNYTCEPGPNHLSNLIGVIVPDASFVSHPAISVIRVLLAGGCVFLSFVAIVSTKEAHRLGQSVFLGHVSKKTDVSNFTQMKQFKILNFLTFILLFFYCSRFAERIGQQSQR